MFAVRPIHLVACLAACAMAVAGCAGTGTGTGAGGQPLQSLAGSGDEQSQAMTVLVNDFEFSPDVEVVDREFDAKLSAKLGGAVGPGAIKTITFKRVADEIGATVVAILHEEVSLKAKVGGDEDIPPKGTTLVITGRLRATEQGAHSEKNPVRFGAGTAADVALLQVMSGAKKQLLNFTAQAQSGNGSGGGVNKRTLDAEIAAVLGSMSAPDVKLSPDVEAQARGIGRAIADRIVAFTMQQGWAHRVSAPPPLATEKPAVENEPTGKGAVERSARRAAAKEHAGCRREARRIAGAAETVPLSGVQQKRTREFVRRRPDHRRHRHREKQDVAKPGNPAQVFHHRRRRSLRLRAKTVWRPFPLKIILQVMLI